MAVWGQSRTGGERGQQGQEMVENQSELGIWDADKLAQTLPRADSPLLGEPRNISPPSWHSQTSNQGTPLNPESSGMGWGAGRASVHPPGTSTPLHGTPWCEPHPAEPELGAGVTSALGHHRPPGPPTSQVPPPAGTLCSPQLKPKTFLFSLNRDRKHLPGLLKHPAAEMGEII